MTEAERGARGPGDGSDGVPAQFDDDLWDVFLADDDQADPLPEEGDFWLERD